MTAWNPTDANSKARMAEATREVKAACGMVTDMFMDALHAQGESPGHRKFRAAKCGAARKWLKFAAGQAEGMAAFIRMGTAKQMDEWLPENLAAIVRAREAIEWIGGVEADSGTLDAGKFAAMIEERDREVAGTHAGRISA